MKITICEFTGNFVSGASSEAIAAINLDASLTNYRCAVEQSVQAIGGIEVEWDIRDGEGDPSRYFRATLDDANITDEDDAEYFEGGQLESIQFAVDAIRERVFSQGTFWINN